MKKLLLLSLLGFATAAPALGQQIVKDMGPAIPDTCYARPEVVHTRVLPPAAFLAQRRGQRPAANRSTIVVTYSGFTPAAQAAFQYAVDIWQSILISDVPIRINATWKQLDPGVLGSAGPSSLYQLSGYGERISNAQYPTALAEKLVGYNINNTTADINASFSSAPNWYLGTDGNVPAGKFDLVSVVLHELGHGLGFLTDKNYIPANPPTVPVAIGALSSPPSIYADFMENGAGLHLADTRLFANPSPELAVAFTSNDLYFDSPLTRAANNGNRARLYAPTPDLYRAGSSISHLDENTYGAGDPNSLMSPQFASGEAIHSPGPIMLAMFNDMGWFNTAVRHRTPYTDTETSRAFPVTASVQSDGTVTPGSVKLNYSFNNGPLVTLPMTATGTTNEYTATIPSPGSGVRVSYYIEASDNETQRIYTAPGRDAFATVSNRYSFFVGPDVVAPSLIHTPPPYLFASSLPYTITAQAADNIGIASVTLEYSVNGTARPSITMTKGSGSSYTAVLGAASTPLVAGDVVSYRLVAQDNSSNANRTTLPASGYFTVPVVELRPAADMYANAFESPTPIDFVGAGFSITTPTGFANGAIHSAHPYANNTDYTYQLLVPIRVKADPQIARMRFDEIVLVEPGEEKSVFPNADFYDYVVVEGSLNGTDWTPLAPGYDARDNANWLDLYTKAQSGDNSAAVGTPSIYASRTISLLNKFKAGDVVQLRFRLHADAGAYGWGWAIDNLHIQDNTVTASPSALQAAGVSLFPNPSTGLLTLQTRFDKPVDRLDVVVRNLLGQEVFRQTRAAVRGPLALPLNLSNCANGLYSVSLTADGETTTRKVLLNR